MMSVLIIFFYWSAMDSHSKSEVLEIFNMTKKNFIAWFLFLKPSPIWQLLKIFSKVVRWPITWLNSTIFTRLPVRPVIKWAFGRRCQKVVSRGREDTRVWYRETMFSQMVSYEFLLHGALHGYFLYLVCAPPEKPTRRCEPEESYLPCSKRFDHGSHSIIFFIVRV